MPFYDLQTTPASKAEALNQQFYSVFTKEDKTHQLALLWHFL